MGLFNWFTTPAVSLIHTDEQGNEHCLTSEQYGEKCVVWAVGMAKAKSIELCAFGRVRNTQDTLAKIPEAPQIAIAHGTAFFVAVYSTYPVIRLGISNEMFKGIVQGVNNSIRGGNYLAGHAISQEKLGALISDVGQCIAILLETAGRTNQPDQDRMLFGIGGACQRLLDTLNHEYTAVSIKQKNEVIERVPKDKSSLGNWFDGSYKNPAIEATRKIDSTTLLASTYANAATQFVKGTDGHRSLFLRQ